MFFCTYAMLTTFNAGAAGANSMATLLIFRFFGGAFGSSPLTNAGGVIADMFSADDRGLAMSLFASAPFLGPCLGPITGGFLGEAAGWRWVEGYLAIFSGTLWIIGSLVVPETYAPVLLRRRANKLSKRTGKAYKTAIDIRNGDKSLGSELKVALSRPWKLLFMEPIVLAISIFMAIVYGTMYMVNLFYLFLSKNAQLTLQSSTVLCRLSYCLPVSQASCFVKVPSLGHFILTPSPGFISKQRLIPRPTEKDATGPKASAVWPS